MKRVKLVNFGGTMWLHVFSQVQKGIEQQIWEEEFMSVHVPISHIELRILDQIRGTVR